MEARTTVKMAMRRLRHEGEIQIISRALGVFARENFRDVPKLLQVLGAKCSELNMIALGWRSDEPWCARRE